LTSTIIDGREIADRIEAELARDVAKLERRRIQPKLVVVRVGEDPASLSYVRAKGQAAARVGIAFEEVTLPESIHKEALISKVRQLNDDPLVHGYLIQLPLPAHIPVEPILGLMDPAKDVDGFHPRNLGKLLRGDVDGLIPCTPAGIIEMLMRSGHDPAGRHCVIVGRSNLVGKPLSDLLIQKRRGGNATVTVCHTRTSDLTHHTRQADILIAAAGRPDTITANMVTPGTVVIDVGVNRVDDPTRPRGYRLVGDVEFDEMVKIASAITPVPGGVGPMTVAMVIANTVKAALTRQQREKD